MMKSAKSQTDRTVALPSNSSSFTDVISLKAVAEEAHPYSIYSKQQKYCIVLLSAFAGMFSTISSPIYLPVLPVLQKYFDTTEELMNLTVVVYSVFQGLAPSVFSNLADRYGRRIVIMACLLAYMLVNIGIALNNTFAGLIVLRCLQAASIASTLSVASGVVSDLTLRSERGLYMGISTGLTLTGQAVGAIIGGLIQHTFGWRAIFWFLSIASGSTLLVIALLLPETNRSIVGNGASQPTKWRILAVPVFSRKPKCILNPTIAPQKPFNILAPLRVLRCTEVLLILVPASVVYASWLMMLTTLSNSLSKSYGYSTIHVSIMYIPSGVAGMLGSILGGELLNWNYRRRHDHYLEKCLCGYYHSGTQFNYLKARIPVLQATIFIAIAGLITFGWSIDKQVHVAVVMVASFFVALSAMASMSIASTILVDMFPNSSSAAVACLNLTRCLSAAVGLAILSILNKSITIGGTYSWLTSLVFLSSLCAHLAYRYSDKLWFSCHLAESD